MNEKNPLKDGNLNEIFGFCWWIFKTTCDLISFKVVIIKYELPGM